MYLKKIEYSAPETSFLKIVGRKQRHEAQNSLLKSFEKVHVGNTKFGRITKSFKSNDNRILSHHIDRVVYYERKCSIFKDITEDVKNKYKTKLETPKRNAK